MLNILVTGGCGFIGSNFINYFLDKYDTYKVYNIDSLNYCASKDNVKDNKNYKFIQGDITDKSLISFILNEFNIDTIIHFAAQSHVDSSFDSSLQYTKDNILGTHVLLECSRLYGKIERFIHFSTDEVYGEVDLSHPGCKETSLLNPTNPYAATKAAAEFLVSSYNHSFKLPYIIIRCNNVYGPNQYKEKLIPKFIDLLKSGNKCTIHGNGETRRNFIHSYDVATAVDTVLKSKVLNTIINIGTFNEYSVMDITKLLIKYIHNIDSYESYITFVEDRPFNDFRYSIDSSKLRELGWKETINFEEGLKNIARKIHRSDSD
jgi:dTDP-glucose 4,6-dehydratase